MPGITSRAATATAQSATAHPAQWSVTGLGAIAALITATAHLSPAWSAAVFSAATAAGTIFTAAQVRPVEVPAISGAATVILGDLALLGLKVPPEVLGALTGVFTFALGTVLHMMHVQYTSTAPPPAVVAAARSGTVGPEVMREIEAWALGRKDVTAEAAHAAGKPPPGP